MKKTILLALLSLTSISSFAAIAINDHQELGSVTIVGQKNLGAIQYDSTYGGTEDVSVAKFKDSKEKVTCYVAVRTISGTVAKIGGAVAPSITCLKD